MQRRAKKPLILAAKIKLANLIRAKWKVVGKVDRHIGGYYWTGKFEKPDSNKVICVYFQLYSRLRTVDYVDLHWMPDFTALTPKEIKELLTELS